MTIAVLDYGMGNLRSVERALAHVGGHAELTADPAAVERADACVIPGVGHFGACMRALAEGGLDGAIHAFVATGRPVFGVCLGMQVLFAGSDEAPEQGLGIIPGCCRRLPRDVKVPHMGWNTVEWVAPHPYLVGLPDDASFYFVHSFAADTVEGVTTGVTRYGTAFSAAVARDNVFATQFHPEKSSDAGLHLYERFVEAVASS